MGLTMDLTMKAMGDLTINHIFILSMGLFISSTINHIIY